MQTLFHATSIVRVLEAATTLAVSFSLSHHKSIPHQEPLLLNVMPKNDNESRDTKSSSLSTWNFHVVYVCAKRKIDCLKILRNGNFKSFFLTLSALIIKTKHSAPEACWNKSKTQLKHWSFLFVCFANPLFFVVKIYMEIWFISSIRTKTHFNFIFYRSWSLIIWEAPHINFSEFLITCVEFLLCSKQVQRRVKVAKTDKTLILIDRLFFYCLMKAWEGLEL